MDDLRVSKNLGVNSEYLTGREGLCNPNVEHGWKYSGLSLKKNGWFSMILAKFLTKISPKMQNLGQSDP